MREIGLQVAARAEEEWRRRCAAAGYTVRERGAGGQPSVWLIVLERNQSPMASRLQFQRLGAPIILVTEQVCDAATLAERLPVPLLLTRAGVASTTLADLCVMVGSMATGSGIALVGGEERGVYGW